ncbi:Holliday junction branch migration protein RuvA [Oceanicella actignis]|uniref:Holliday junction branch migration protein RuvA n=1 Tax=Oceanicella actignis TaxID=1189325 RepID=UPI0011E69D49|nr:Holliday junction branch migration protein RuvA [Oceanicella actignis]TYO90424.1 Holliday junction DNA helicase subunit RuvA [Oceanicella actignis]
MIGKITGRIDHIAEDHVLIEAAGVGYVIHCSARTLRQLPPAGEVAALYTELLVREDLMQLFGFATLLEKEWHRLLCSVQGVGAKAALAILGELGPEALSLAIAAGDARMIRAAPGVGPKLAARVVNELRDKAPALMHRAAPPARPAAPPVPPAEGAPEAADAPPAGSRARRKTAAKDPAAAEARAAQLRAAEARAAALAALRGVGFSAAEAAAAVAEAADRHEGDEKALIEAALRKLAPKT